MSAARPSEGDRPTGRGAAPLGGLMPPGRPGAITPPRGRTSSATADAPILAVENLVTEFRTGGGWHPAVRDVSFAVQHNETLAIVGESGCGKSVTALSIMGLVPPANGRIAGGHIRFAELDLVTLDEEELRRIRGDRISMIFQEPMTSLNPVLTVGFQVAEALSYHRDMGRREADAAALGLLDQVKIPSARARFADYPHQFSGGMRQRVMIAMALACRPELLLADEPTTALDVTIQAEVLALLAELKTAYGMAMIFITHNLGVVASIADRVAAMYAGEIVEIAPVNELFARPTHPYTELLLRSIPRVDRDMGGLTTIAGQVPAISAMPSGCRFAPRCPFREPVCTSRDPVLVPLPDAPDHQVRCWLRAPPVRGLDMPDSVLTVTGLRKFFTVKRGFPRVRTVTVRALDGISFHVRDGEAFGLVGESGCGKSTAGRAGAAPGRARRGGDRLQGRERGHGEQGAHARVAPQAADHLPGPLRLAQSAPADRQGADRADARARHCQPGGMRRARARAAGRGRSSRQCDAALPARVQRRPAPAHRHRPRAHPGAGTAGGGRAGLRPRRLDPGADTAVAAAAAGAPQARVHLHLARPRRRPLFLPAHGGHVSRPHRRDRADPGDLPGAAASLYQDAARRVARPRSAGTRW